MGVDPAEVANNSDFDENENKLDETLTLDHIFFNQGEFKDDRVIFKNPVENSQYNLIERPAYLLSFN